MNLMLESATKGFVSSFEEEEYELTKIFSTEPDSENENEKEENNGDDSKTTAFPEEGREIFEDDEDNGLIREYF